MRQRRLERALVAVPLLVTAVVTPAFVGGGGDDELLAEGEELYQTGCSSCHGADGRGVVGDDGRERGPSLENSGEAAAFYYLSTGRMPLGNSEEQPERKEPAYNPEEIEALVAYVGTLGTGPELPDVDPASGDLALGGEVFRANCQACHGAAGTGGALSYGRAAPRLGPATPEEVGAAVRVGPGEMPVFGPDILDPSELDSLVRYVEYLDDPEDPGGLPIGRTGPIPEGFVAWLVGMVALLALVAWIGTRSPIPRARRVDGTRTDRAEESSAEGRSGE
ncbi:MAG TPA: c-type cytochrome [Acidimicrobiales bacterium]|nr:c-type cytochrome [Acidimicrobiales bacterium]